MQNNDNHSHQKPPRPPPLSVSLPSPPRHDPIPVPRPKPAQPNPKPAQPNPKTAQPIPKPAQPIPKPAQPIPKPAQPSLMSAQPIPKTAHPSPKTAQPSLMPAQLIPKPTQPSPMPAQPTQTHKPKPKLESPHSPPRSESPTLPDDPETPKPSSTTNDTALVPHEKFYSPLTSPLPPTPPKDAVAPPPQHIIHFSRREDSAAQSGVVLGGGGERKDRVGGGVRLRGMESMRRSTKEDVVKKAGLGLRVLEIIFCLISFSVMAADKTQGWSGDSFDRYKEYRFCLTVAIFGFLYAAFQAYDLGSHLATGKHVITHRLRYQFDFIMDQILAYLLISASSAAASRVDDWQTNWGKDEFTEKASASISMAFLAFVCFASSSLISGYNLCNRDIY